MFSFAWFVSWIREILRPGVLWFFRNPNDPDFDPLKEMVELPSLRHARRLFLSVLLYGFVITILIWGPILTAKTISPSLFPLQLITFDWMGNLFLSFFLLFSFHSNSFISFAICFIIFCGKHSINSIRKIIFNLVVSKSWRNVFFDFLFV